MCIGDKMFLFINEKRPSKYLPLSCFGIRERIPKCLFNHSIKFRFKFQHNIANFLFNEEDNTINHYLKYRVHKLTII